MLSASDLASMQAEMIASHPDFATVVRSSPVPDGQGGKTDTWEAVKVDAYPEGYPVRVLPWRVQAENAVTGKILATTDYRLYLPVDADVTAKDRIKVGAVTYEVQDVESGESDAVCLVAHCARIG